jgi:hypothetical protein
MYGRNDPPRIAFSNPTVTSPIDGFGRRVSIECVTGPFTTGIMPNGSESILLPSRRSERLLKADNFVLPADTGTGFSLAQIKANPPALFIDVHIARFTAGAIPGQVELTGTVF